MQTCRIGPGVLAMWQIYQEKCLRKKERSLRRIDSKSNLYGAEKEKKVMKRGKERRPIERKGEGGTSLTAGSC